MLEDDARAISLLSRSSYVSGIILDGEIGARSSAVMSGLIKREQVFA